MKIDLRYATHPEDAKRYDTETLRRHFLMESLFEPNGILLTYSTIDRVVVGGVLPTTGSVALTAPKEIGSPTFLARRELGAFNIGGPGRVVADGAVFELANRDAIYIGKDTADVRFESVDPANPARFYVMSTPAHARCETRLITAAQAKTMAVGDAAKSNKRVINQYILPGICDTCQLVMGLTQLEPGSMWNTMPAHTHGRRCEVYFYFDLAEDARVFHLLGEPTETRHLVVKNEQTVISPSWSIHSGVGTSNYAFIWGMGGDNVDYTDMDWVAMETLR
ncbi:5-dehydro-4-deoxy-D-glucuronate isomerase [Azospirillum thermophilum]|uniref:4-deoxy-L-threo-5-hexosulose-uronate ketol-isomerase n=1 Tax=Azospirillum thermophilum TaxID=2202148 RepID=A0A2S2CUC8_9PROT|nr:5-dehydro-4-deoxy-D-glucuronate isomerase [Azospirillum thermophilum]AWK88112.1 5-dehydro-4-deoxy-D-glucuronate isomerase [Azospirillum thermophilum]